MISISKGEHAPTLVLKKRPGELGNGLLAR